MKMLLFLTFFFILNVNAQTTLSSIDLKHYSPQKKGVNDLVFEVSNKALTKTLNDQMIFGKLNHVSFTVYWTLKPERLAIEVNGLPEGFKEIKEELKASIISKIENAIPLSLEKKFAQYDVTQKKPLELSAKDKTNLNPIPEYIFKLGNEGQLQELVGLKPVGLYTIKFENLKFPWSDQKWVTKRTEVVSEDGPQITKTFTSINFTVLNGIGLPNLVSSKTIQTVKMDPKSKPIERSFEEEIEFKKYKVNTGEAVKWFISHGTNR